MGVSSPLLIHNPRPTCPGTRTLCIEICSGHTLSFNVSQNKHSSLHLKVSGLQLTQGIAYSNVAIIPALPLPSTSAVTDEEGMSITFEAISLLTFDQMTA